MIMMMERMDMQSKVTKLQELCKKACQSYIVRREIADLTRTRVVVRNMENDEYT